MKILGIDPGFGRCGYAVLEKSAEKLHLVNSGTITTKSGDPFPERLAELANDIESILKRFSPEIVSIEDLFFVQNVTTGIQVAQARGVVILLAQKYGCRIVEPKPVEIKSCFTGNGKATKTDMKNMVQMVFQLEKSPKIDDAADAIGAAFWASQNTHLDL